jgi:hypothetical protein
MDPEPERAGWSSFRKYVNCRRANDNVTTPRSNYFARLVVDSKRQISS